MGEKDCELEELDEEEEEVEGFANIARVLVGYVTKERQIE